jgi:O-antigen ligase
MRAAVATLWAPDLRGGARVAWMLSGCLALLLLFEAPRQPLLVVLLPFAGIGLYLAARSPAWPLGIMTGGALISLVAAGNLPKGGTVAGYTAWLLLGLTITLIRRDRVHPPLRLALDFSAAGTVALGALMLARLPASADYEYGLNKIELYLIVCFVPYVVGVVVGFVRRDLELFFKVYVVMALGAALYNSYLLATGGANRQFSNRYSIDASIDVIGLGRTMGEVSLVLLFMMVRTKSVRTRVLLALALAPIAMTFVSSGSRGPVIGMGIALPSVMLWRAASPAIAKRLALSLVAVGALAVVAVVAFVPPEATQRSLSIFQTTEEAGDTSRFVLWGEATQAFADNIVHTIVGIGTGGYAAISTTGSLYPHNIVLEVGSELGVLGILAFAVFAIAVIVRLLGLLARGGDYAGWAGLLLTLFTFSLVNAQFSGDVPYNEGLWLWGGLASGLVAAARAGSHYQSRQRS